jgi:hypothetical protein
MKSYLHGYADLAAIAAFEAKFNGFSQGDQS